MAKAIGIDLGTTNSVVAVMEGDKPTVIVNSENRSSVRFAARLTARLLLPPRVLVPEVPVQPAATGPARALVPTTM